MARNVEIKAKLINLASIEKMAATRASNNVEIIKQDDTFFPCDSGRLKLREFSDGTGELIYYRRGDTGGPKESFYLRSPTEDPGTLRESLALAYGTAGRVQKTRALFIVGRTRVHLDTVTDLGQFMELEVVLEEHESVEDGVKEAEQLMQYFGVTQDQLIEGAYVDLLSAKPNA